MRLTSVIFLGILCCLLIACGPKPIPSNKAGFVGEWTIGSAFRLNINANGTARLFQLIDPASPDYDKLCIKVGPRIIEGMQVKFLVGDVLELAKPTLYGRTYKIDRPPYQDGDSVKMVLNGVVLVKQ